ncbi:hypothetical protein GLOTRDRAFT_127160 [Gloeophyllum trabeum ATCC 11539]|uniref:Uncharacterized protein n=1 Tax=Gloeophyllum trabeum (strain ATCC 11539 / FP-39264 / Madison 617) TaxID=670483 RepID=S7RV71_GLOTA|nr:uncharacterized protein GLOTRDRAFT_127160 [Gloeophyllum trabeum ATCC 11539]EPQ58670.1 hypothetical protein GLOTRDRAFT_127160 [Gloeophyllum trabeum ATCC 11539]
MSNLEAHRVKFAAALKSLESEGVNICRHEKTEWGKASSADGQSFTIVFPDINKKFEGSADVKITSPTFKPVTAQVSYTKESELTGYRRFKVHGVNTCIVIVLDNGVVIVIDDNSSIETNTQGSGNWSTAE